MNSDIKPQEVGPSIFQFRAELDSPLYANRTLDLTRRPIRLLIADDHPVVRLGVRHMLQSREHIAIAGEAGDGKEAIKAIKELHPDILLLDLNMPCLPGLDTLRELTTAQVPIKTILMVSVISPREVLEALQLGARGVVLKSVMSTDLYAAISSVIQGNFWLGGMTVHNLVPILTGLMDETNNQQKNKFGLTPREFEVIRLISLGLTNKEIGMDFEISEQTVKRHLGNIFDKVGVSSRLELALYAMNHELVAQDRVSV